MADQTTPQTIQTQTKTIMVADASRYVAKKGVFVNQEVVCLTFLDYGKLNYKVLPIDVAKKFLPIIPGEGKESLTPLLGLKLQVITTLATL